MLDWSQNEMSRQLDCSWIAQIARNERPPPLDQLDGWADKLKLTGEDRDLFYELAWQKHSHEKIREVVERLRAKVLTLQRKLDDNEQAAQANVDRIAEQARMIDNQMGDLHAARIALDQCHQQIALARARGFIA